LKRISAGKSNHEGEVISTTYSAVSDMTQKLFNIDEKLSEEEKKILAGQIN
jgi:hypothetical protein